MNIIKRFWNWLTKGNREEVSRSVIEDNIPRYGRKKAKGRARTLHRRAAREYLNGNTMPMDILSRSLQGKGFLNCGKNLLSKVTKKARSTV